MQGEREAEIKEEEEEKLEFYFCKIVSYQNSNILFF